MFSYCLLEYHTLQRFSTINNSANCAFSYTSCDKTVASDTLC